MKSALVTSFATAFLVCLANAAVADRKWNSCVASVVLGGPRLSPLVTDIGRQADAAE